MADYTCQFYARHLSIFWFCQKWRQSWIRGQPLSRHRTSQGLKIIKIAHGKSPIVTPTWYYALELWRTYSTSFATNISMLSVTVSSIASQFTTSLTLTFQAADLFPKTLLSWRAENIIFKCSGLTETTSSEDHSLSPLMTNISFSPWKIFLSQENRLGYQGERGKNHVTCFAVAEYRHCLNIPTCIISPNSSTLHKHCQERGSKWFIFPKELTAHEAHQPTCQCQVIAVSENPLCLHEM